MTADRSTGTVVMRVALVIVSALAVVLLVRQLEIVRDQERATTLAASRGGPAVVAEALRLFDDAASRTSDTTPMLSAVQLLLFAKQPERALLVARRAVRAEPENARAWLALSQAAGARHPADVALAERRIRQLVRTPPS